ncbi:EamA family transporter [Mycobacterium celatum]|uniref:EamA family transporter n=2 Tax=Mycobacterium celatum TaxID=28045 RepID=A0A2G5PRC6_MYCCE|nr:EamA family transporter [Mycobacterium celatum]PIB80504.1 EamA family transporter [Mycobacterium celatum]
MIGAAYAQLSAVSYGVSDFVGGVAARRVAALRVMLVSYPVASVFLGLLAVHAGGPIHPGAILWGSLYGLSQAIGVWWFYAAMSSGPISVVSPLAAVLNAAVPIAVGVALGERPGETASVGVVLAMIAVFLVGRESPDDEDVRTHRFTRRVAWLTVGAGVAFGLDFVLLHQAPVECRLWPLFFARASASVLVFAVAAATGNFQLPTKTPLRLAMTAAALDTFANVAMLMALHAWLLSLASMLISLYPAATVVLAMVVLRERVTRWQATGMVLAMVAVAMITAS